MNEDPYPTGSWLLGSKLRDVPYGGFWGTAHETRTNFSMLLGSIFLHMDGAGSLSIDLTCFGNEQGTPKYFGITR